MVNLMITNMMTTDKTINDSGCNWPSCSKGLFLDGVLNSMMRCLSCTEQRLGSMMSSATMLIIVNHVGTL